MPESIFTRLLGMPPNASLHGAQLDFLLGLIHILMGILFLGWGIFFVYVLVRFRRSRQPKADYQGVRSHTSNYIEIAVAIFEAILLVGFAIPFWSKNVNALPTAPETLKIRVIAEQFAWNIHYPGSDAVFGRSDIKFMDKQSNPLGLDPADPKGKDDVVTLNQMHLAVGRPVIIYLTSKDVIHSLALPIMRVRQDAIPGMVIPVTFTPIKTGPSEIACAQLCGLGHYRMKGYVHVEPPEEFEKWLRDQAPAADASSDDNFWY